MIGSASSAVGPAEAVSGVKSENRRPSALATPTPTPMIDAATTKLPTMSALARLRVNSMQTYLQFGDHHGSSGNSSHGWPTSSHVVLIRQLDARRQMGPHL